MFSDHDKRMEEHVHTVGCTSELLLGSPIMFGACTSPGLKAHRTPGCRLALVLRKVHSDPAGARGLGQSRERRVREHVAMSALLTETTEGPKAPRADGRAGQGQRRTDTDTEASFSLSSSLCLLYALKSGSWARCTIIPTRHCMYFLGAMMSLHTDTVLADATQQCAALIRVWPHQAPLAPQRISRAAIRSVSTRGIESSCPFSP